MSHIRPMHESDWPGVALVYQQGLDTNDASFATEVPSWEEWNAEHFGINRYVIEENGQIAAFTSLMPFSGKNFYSGVAEISLYVKNGMRGNGLGTTLMNYQLEEARNNGFWALTSLIMDTNAVSVKLHEKCGFKLVGTYEKFSRDRYGKWRDVIVMQAVLS